MLYREPMWLKWCAACSPPLPAAVSVLYREPMWLKSMPAGLWCGGSDRFSALP